MAYLSGSPWLGSLRRNCGGVLLNRRTIMTSASCLKNTIFERVRNTLLMANPGLNEFEPTYNTIYNVYVGAGTYPGFGFLPSNDTIQVFIDDIIVVSV
jgi:hypothetical protein